MKITEYERGHNDAKGEIIAWLQAEALRMDDRGSARVLNSAAFSIGVMLNTPEARARVVQRARHGTKGETPIASQEKGDDDGGRG